ncbi:MAG TPA: STAS/SEC14 domain-containing protein [Adhaeribacter sp.]|nr:STAS/SEC14 domain-containing protein [Adhaeribacter sp.]
MVYFEQPYAKIEIEQERNLLVLTWHGFANSEEFREVRSKAIELSRTHQVEKWLSNMKEMKAIRQADQDWSVNDWLPLFQSLHLKKWAIVIADDMFNQMAMSSMMSKIRPKLDFPVEYFQDLTSARSWLERP